MTDTLNVMGTAEVDIPSGLFITSIKVDGSPSNLDEYDCSHVQYSTTVSNSLSRQQRNGSGSVTYEITVLNNTSREYAFRGLYYQTQASGYDNDRITERTQNANTRRAVIPSFPNGKKVASGQTLTFQVTYTLGSDLGRNNTYKTLINYQFGINVDSEEEAVDAVHDKFLLD